jgi:hypothetical protein
MTQLPTPTTRMRIGEWLMHDGLCTKAQLREAWDAKTAYGDRLGTNLLAIGVIDECQLAATLSKQHHVPAAPLAQLQPMWLSQVLPTLPRDLLVRARALPLGPTRTGGWVLACVDPAPSSWARLLAAAPGIQMVPTVVCEARLWDLHERYLSHRTSLRPNPLNSVRPPVHVRREEAQHDTMQELTSEAEFQQMYAQLHARHGNDDDDGDNDNSDNNDDRGAPENVLVGLLLPSAPSEDVPMVPFVVEQRGAALTADPLTAQAAVGSLEEVELSDVAAEESPLTFAQAQLALANAGHRDDIGHILLRAARMQASRAALVLVHPDQITGWMGDGEGMGHVRRFAVPRAQPSVFQRVVEGRSPVVGPLSRHVAHGHWIKCTGKRIPASVAVLPILLRGNVVQALWLDNGHEAHVNPDVSTLLLLLQQAAARLEALMADDLAG